MPYRDETTLEMLYAQSNTFEFVTGLHVGQTIVDRIMASEEVIPAGRVYDYIYALSNDSPERREVVFSDPITKWKIFRNEQGRQAFIMGEMLGIHDRLCRHLGSDYESLDPEVLSPEPTQLSERKRKLRPEDD